MCRGAESKFFNGPTNITSFRFLVFGVKGLLQANSSVKNAMLFNVLSFFSDKLLTEGNTVATLDELYIWLSNFTAVEYIRRANLILFLGIQTTSNLVHIPAVNRANA